jgi:cell division protein FtsL
VSTIAGGTLVLLALSNMVSCSITVAAETLEERKKMADNSAEVAKKDTKSRCIFL